MANSALLPLEILPGITRDGTEFDSKTYIDGQWVRFQNGRPKKIGGYRQILNSLSGPIRNIHAWPTQNLTTVFTFYDGGIELTKFNNVGIGGVALDVSPAGFTTDENILWSADTIFDAAVGSEKKLCVALPGSLINDLYDSTEKSLYTGDGVGAFTVVSDANAVASGGVYVLHPYTVLYGNDGKVTWSNINEPKNYTTGAAGSARVTKSKIIKGLPVPSGTGPSGILWSIDAVLKQEWIGGNQIFKFSTLSANTSIISANSVVEYDGAFFWIGLDSFYVCDGNRVMDLPNNMNLTWFYEHVNKNHQTKIWGQKNSRYGEIWWYFPKDEETECSHALVYNVKDKIWFDVEISRQAGIHQQALYYPLMSGETSINSRILTLTGVTGSFAVSDIVVGTSTGATGIVTKVDGDVLTVNLLTSTEFVAVDDNVTTNAVGNVGALSKSAKVYSLYLHEYEYDAVSMDTVTAIKSWVTTPYLGLPTGMSGEPIDSWVRVTRVEPDISTTTDMSFQITSKETAQDETVVSEEHTFSPDTDKIDIRGQYRFFNIKFTSNDLNGAYHMGKSLIHLESGDIRN